jgi:AraC-like DNA-binding protein
VIITACLPPERLERLRLALPEPDRLHTAADWEHAGSIIRRQAVDVLVADPCFGSGEPDASPVIALRDRYRSVPVVIYTALSARTVGPIATLGRNGFEHLVLHGVDDAPWQLRALLAAQPGVALAERLIERLRPALRSVPTDVAGALERVIHTPAAFQGVPDLAAAADVSRRTIYRECERAKLASPREIIAAARVLRAYAFLRESDHAIEDVAEALRFSSAHHLTKTMRWACGMTTARARERITPDELIDLLVSRLMPSDAREVVSFDGFADDDDAD